MYDQQFLYSVCLGLGLGLLVNRQPKTAQQYFIISYKNLAQSNKAQASIIICTWFLQYFNEISIAQQILFSAAISWAHV